MDYTTKISRGEVFYITSKNDTVGSEQRNGRPAVVVSNNECNTHSTVIEVCYLTLQEKTPLPTHVFIDRGACINSTVLCEQVTSISKERVGDFMCRLPDDIMDKVDMAIVKSLDLSYLMGTCEARPVDDSDSESEIKSLKAHIESLRAENERLLKDNTSLEGQLKEARIESQSAGMYERMYNDLLDRIMKR